MEPIIIVGICCLVILFIAGAVNGAYDQLDYYKSTLFQESTVQSKWSPQRILKWFAIVFSWCMIFTFWAYFICLIVINHGEGCVKFIALSIGSIVLGLAIGMAIIDVITKAVCKERGIVFMPRCL